MSTPPEVIRARLEALDGLQRLLGARMLMGLQDVDQVTAEGILAVSVGFQRTALQLADAARYLIETKLGTAGLFVLEGADRCLDRSSGLQCGYPELAHPLAVGSPWPHEFKPGAQEFRRLSADDLHAIIIG